ncbi:MAG: 1,4-alpha-glucan branching protein GlgB [Lachnospiraceae bacterium]|nr:1,4-alpha-glucan branching protein GlgB [Lachnospiraceae bacterium]
MDKTLYDLMDWAGIEEIVYSEAANPERLLGPHVTEQGLLIQCFIPTAVSVTVKVKTGGKKYPMEQQDEAGFYAVLVPRKSLTDYTLLVTYDTGMTEELHDPYAFATLYHEAELKRFEAGIDYEIYRKMGAHPMKINGVDGVYFSVWAPCAMRVSVVGDFNLWDGRRHQMRRLGDSGVFDLFIPGLEKGLVYKYEIKNQKGEPMLKADPYGNFSELRPNTASVVWDLGGFPWNDEAWMTERAKTDSKTKPMSIYELHLGSWMRKAQELDENGAEIVGSEFCNYREIAPKLAAYVKDLGYTHIELMPVMEHPLDASWGYQVTGYYAPTSRYGTPDDFMYFMNYMHEQAIGVILDWVPAHFPRDAYGLACFDGTCVYEHKDPRQGAHPHWGTLIYNYGRPQVTNFLIANALFWAKEYHADGIRMDAVASMLYLDYGKNDGEWVANIYGGHENLEAVEFLKHLNSVFKKQAKGAVLIAEESTAWPQITGDVKEGGLGFDYKWNMGWMNDFTGYMQYDPYFRCHHYGELTFSMLYTYSENFVLVFSHDEVVHGKSSMLCKMPGDSYEVKAENLRAAYGFMYAHPGKKLLFMGQEFAQISEWNENEELPWDILQYPLHKTMQDYVKALNALYRTQPALYEKDFQPEGFEWINCTSGSDNILAFLRKTDKPEETLLFVCNFAPIAHKGYKVGVPFYGKYKEVFNSDDAAFGGSGRWGTRTKNSKQEACDERENCLVLDVPPMAMVAFSCTPMPAPEKKVVEKKTAAKPVAKKKSAAKPAAEKKAAAKPATKKPTRGTK